MDFCQNSHVTSCNETIPEIICHRSDWIILEDESNQPYKWHFPSNTILDGIPHWALWYILVTLHPWSFSRFELTHKAKTPLSLYLADLHLCAMIMYQIFHFLLHNVRVIKLGGKSILFLRFYLFIVFFCTQKK